MKRSYVTLVLRLSRRWVNEICAGDYRFDGRVSRAGIPDAGDREVCGGENAFFRRRHRVRMQLAHVMRELETMGCIFRRPSASKRGGYALYRWRSSKVINQVAKSDS